MLTGRDCLLDRTSLTLLNSKSTSCESNHTSAYHEDIQWRIIYQHYFCQETRKDIAQNLNIDKSTVNRVIALFDATGDVKKASYPTGPNHHL